METKTIPTTETSETPQINIVFMGTPHFASTILQRVLDAKYNIVAIYTRPDGRVGRKQEIAESPVKILANQAHIPCEQPSAFDDVTLEKLKSYKPDLILVVAYGKILPETILSLPGFGCINVHPSLLPKFRGPSPLQNALLHGEQNTGTTIMLMDAGMDTGDIIAQEHYTISSTDTLPSLTETLADISGRLLLETLPLWIERAITPQKQDDSQATLCQLIERADGQFVWLQDAESLYNRYRALTPWPGVYCFWKRESLLRLKLHTIGYQKNNSQTHHAVGEVFEIGEKIGVQVGMGIIFLEEVQLEGKTKVTIQEFIKGYPDFIGAILQ